LSSAEAPIGAAHFQSERYTAARRVKVTGDGSGVAAHAGALLLGELADRVGLTDSLSAAMAHTRQRRSAHDPGVVLTQ
jgi:hypothetical protein